MGSALDRMTARLAGFEIGALDPATIAHVADTWRDLLAVMVGGSAGTEVSQIARRYALRFPGTSPVVGGGTAAPALSAFANGIAASALDYEDGHATGGAMHPASPIIPAIIAASDASTTLGEAWAAHVVGVEVAVRIAYALHTYGSHVWFHGTGLPGAVGAAAAVAALHGGDADVLRRSVQAAFTHAPFANGAWPMIKEAVGWGAMTGLAAAELAELGLLRLPADYTPPYVNINPETSLDLPGAAEDAFLNSAGTVFEAGATYFKPYAACRWLHSAAEATAILCRAHDISADQIERIDVFTHKGATGFSELSPRTPEHGQYSHEMVVSAVVMFGRAGWRELTVEAMADPARQALGARVQLHHEPEMDPLLPAQLPARVRITLCDGRTLTETVLDAPGSPEAPLGAERLHTKWIDLLTARLTSAEAEALLCDLGDASRPLLEVIAPIMREVAS